MVLHFSNGAFHYSLPGAGASDWPEYRNIVRRVWDHTNNYSAHDNYGAFTVNITDQNSPVTRGLTSFQTIDELYFNQAGDTTLIPLFTARSVRTGKDEPLAWTYTYKNARVFQSLLGHGPDSYKPGEYHTILQRAAHWVSSK